jgi:putative membrane protein
MRIIKYILLAIILIAIVVLAVANRGMVTLHLLPEGLSSLGQRSVEVPLHLVGLGLILLGMILGYILEWLREHKHRRRASVKSREAAELNREVTQLRKANAKDDDVLALIGN